MLRVFLSALRISRCIGDFSVHRVFLSAREVSLGPKRSPDLVPRDPDWLPGITLKVKKFPGWLDPCGPQLLSGRDAAQNCLDKALRFVPRPPACV